MHLHMEFLTEHPGLEVPLQYNHWVQAMLYRNIDQDLAEFLHEQGFVVAGRTFKLFAFSRLGGTYEVDKAKGVLRFFDGIRLTISSPVQHFCESLSNILLAGAKVQLGTHTLDTHSIEAEQQTVAGTEVVVQTLSPIVVYSTMLRMDGRKYTCYYQPGDPDFAGIAGNNLRKKYQAFYQTEPPAGEVHISRLGDMRLHVLNYKGTIIKGYSGRLKLTGPQELLQIAVDAGLGSKNSQGFGCVRVKKARV